MSPTPRHDSRAIQITEVGPRDGLQNEKVKLDTESKLRFLNLIAAAGVTEIEVSSFVSPSRVPQLADADEVFRRLARAPGVTYSALVPNERGMERAIAAGVDKIAVFTAASDAFLQRNVNVASLEESLRTMRPVIATARGEGLPVRGYISCVVACPFEGAVQPARVAEVVARLLELGVTEIDLGETIGVASPPDIVRLLESVSSVLPPAEITLHLHDTYGGGLACAVAALEHGIHRFDSSVGGLGGCPFAPGAAGNLATEDLVYHLERMGRSTGIDLERLVKATSFVESRRGRPLTGRAYRAMVGSCDDGRSADESRR